MLSNIDTCTLLSFAGQSVQIGLCSGFNKELPFIPTSYWSVLESVLAISVPFSLY